MGNALFMIVLGRVVVLLGALRIAPSLANKDLPKSLGYLRRQEIGSYVATGIGVSWWCSV